MMSAGADTEASPTLFERFVDIAPQALKCRNDPEDDSCQKRDHDRDSDRGATHVNSRQGNRVGCVRNGNTRGDKNIKQVSGPQRQKRTCSAAEECKHRALSEELTDQPE